MTYFIIQTRLYECIFYTWLVLSTGEQEAIGTLFASNRPNPDEQVIYVDRRSDLELAEPLTEGNPVRYLSLISLPTDTFVKWAPKQEEVPA